MDAGEMKFWTVGDGVHTLVVSKELSALLERYAKLEVVADAAASLLDSHRVGLFDLVLRDEKRLDDALRALDGE